LTEALAAAAEPAASAAPSRLTLDSALDGSGRIESADLREFLAGGQVANLSYVADDGYPATVPLWYVWEDGVFWLAPRAGSGWAERVQRDPRVSLALSEAAPPFRRVLARGRIRPAPDTQGAIEQRFAAKYPAFASLRQIGSRRPRSRTLLRLAPERLIAWRGLAVGLTPARQADAPAAHEDSA
jgi:nitroimidazol reductase NimA-like FMN-containing flavoprotein (pyridoxamine 5'-phosphate oxidase superfamily)